MSKNIISVGQDSFLDIVANLVGVLIILVVVIGAQAKSAWENRETETQPATQQTPVREIEGHFEQVKRLRTKIRETADTVSKLKTDNENLEQQIVNESQLAAEMTDRRHGMLLQMEIVKRDIANRRNQLNAKQQATALLENQKAKLAFELREIERETLAIQTSYQQPVKETIDHYPNPIAETVFSQEVHFRLAGGKLSYVPMDELIDLMKNEWKAKAEKLKQSDGTRETVGPIGNYHMQYELEAYSTPASRNSPASRTVRFKRFLISPINRSAGETIDDALATGTDRSGQVSRSSSSQWASVLRRYKPKSTTVSIWVYPDSYAEHARLKKWLHENEFKMASWPLSAGKMISGGPEGFRTSAQ